MITFKKINLNQTYHFFDDIENIDLNLLSINKKCIKILMLFFMKSNMSQCKVLIIRILIKKLLFVLVLVMQMHTLLKKMKIDT